MNKKFLTVLFGLGLAFTLAACGEQAQETPTTTPPAETTPAGTPPAATPPAATTPEATPPATPASP